MGTDIRKTESPEMRTSERGFDMIEAASGQEKRPAVAQTTDGANPNTYREVGLMPIIVPPTTEIPPQLSRNQRTCLKLWALGLSYNDIAASIYVSRSTVVTHLERARHSYRQAGYDIAPRKAGLMFIARSQGLI